MKIPLIIFLFISGIFGMTVSLVLIKNYKSNLLINIYFILFIIILSLTQSGIGTSLLFFETEIFSDFYIESSISVLTLTTIYFYFKSLLSTNNRVNINEVLLHSIFPFFYFLISVLDKNLQKKILLSNFNETIYYLFGVYVIIYNYLCFTIFYKNFLDKKRQNENSPENKLIFKWIKFIYIIINLLSLYPLAVYWFSNFNVISMYFPISSIILIIICSKLVCSPEVFYGYNILKNKVNENLDSILNFDSIWITTNKINPSNVQDLILKKKIDLNFTEYINQIEHIILNDNFLIQSDIKVKNLSNKLKIPKSHLNYIFKYHSKITFIDLKKLIKIHYATNLIQNDYLKSNTLNCLSKEAGFASYDPFYRSFKKITGTTPLDYYNLIRANK